MSLFVEEAVDEKITTLIDRASNAPWCSIEFFPPKTDSGIEFLFEALEKLKDFNPQFVDFTWGAGGSTSELTLQLCQRAKKAGFVTDMHLTCTNMELEKIDSALRNSKSSGMRNILALRGDPPLGQDVWVAKEGGLTCALDLINYIKKNYGDYFCIGAAGYPEGHPTKMVVVEGDEIDKLSVTELARCSYDEEEVESDAALSSATDSPVQPVRRVFVCRDEEYEAELEYLKKKVDAGANFIVTQMFFDTAVFGSFVAACRSKGITVPIIPGVMCLSSYGGFKRMVKFCKTRVPVSVAVKLESIKHDDAAVKLFGAKLGTEMCRELLRIGAPGLHFYTLNTSALTVEILENLGFPRVSKAQKVEASE